MIKENNSDNTLLLLARLILHFNQFYHNITFKRPIYQKLIFISSKKIVIKTIANSKNVTYFDSFEVGHIPKEIKKFFENKNVITNIYRIQAYDSIMCGYFYIGFIDFMLKGKSLLEYTNLFSLNECKKNDKIILKYFQ